MIEPQIPAEGILLSHKFSDSFSYKVECSCGNPDDSVEIYIERDEFDEIIISFSAKQKTQWWKTLVDWEVHKIDNPILFWIVNTTQSFINGLHQRLKITYSVWSKGYVEYQSSTILSKQATLNMVEAIKNSIEELEKK